MSSRTHSTETPSRPALSRAIASIFSERSTPVTRYPLRASGIACLPLPQPRSSTDDPRRRESMRRISSTSCSASSSRGPNSSGYRSSKIVSNQAPGIGFRSPLHDRQRSQAGDFPRDPGVVDDIHHLGNILVGLRDLLGEGLRGGAGDQHPTLLHLPDDR